MESNGVGMKNGGVSASNGSAVHLHRKMSIGGRATEPQGPVTAATVAAAVPRIANGNILKTALTNPSEVLHLRRRLESSVTTSSAGSGSGSGPSPLPYETAMPTICTLIYCDEFEDIATLRVNI